MHDISRREFVQKSFAAILSYSLFETLFARDLFAREVKPITTHWANQLNETCLDLRKQSITLVGWQE